MENNGGGGGDRLSSLPDPIINQILSYLDMTEVARTCVLSKRWRGLWLSTPVLNFNIVSWFRSFGSPSRRSQLFNRKINDFMDLIDRVLVNEDDKIIKFSLYSADDEVDPNRLLLWLISALRRNTNHLSIQAPVSANLELPDQLFTSKIEELKMRFKSTHPASVPNSMCTAAGIQSLDLKSVVFPKGDESGELVLNFACLKYLVLNDCSVKHLKVVTINTPMLESYESSHFGIDKDTSCKVRPVAPRLKVLHIVERPSWRVPIVDYCMEDEFPCLVSADVYFSSQDSYDLMQKSSSYLRKILPAVGNVQAMTLSICSVKALTDCPELMERLSFLFPNLRYMKLINWYSAPGLDAVLKFLERLPYIETLVWERNSSEWSTGEEWGASEKKIELGETSSFKKIYTWLKTFEIHRIEGIEVELKFLEFLLKRAVLLEKVIIKYTPSFSGKKLLEFKEKLSLLPRASPKVMISVQLQS